MKPMGRAQGEVSFSQKQSLKNLSTSEEERHPPSSDRVSPALGAEPLADRSYAGITELWDATFNMPAAV